MRFSISVRTVPFFSVPDCARRGLCDLLEVDVLGKADVARVDEQGLVAPLQIRAVNDDAAVKAARAQQGLIENFRAVRRRKDHDALRGIEAVDLGKQLVQGLLALVVAAEAAVTAAADGVDLIDKDDSRGDLAGLLEQIAHAARADADEHFHEV